jgi:hypothetical protein
MVIGVYGGKLTIGIEAYVLQLEYEEGGQFRVDTEGAEDGLRIFGMMNEDIHGGEVNAHLEEMGLIRAVQNMVGPCEILTEYGDEYDWDEIKWIGYTALKEEMAQMEGWVSEMKARNMKEALKGNKLEKHMAKIVDGELEAEELHSTTPTLEEGNSLERMLTTGAKMEHFSFRKFGGERKVYENKDIGRNDKRLSGVKRYAQKWLGEETIRCDFKEVRRLNANVNTTCNIIGEIRKSFGGGELGNQSNMIEDVRKQMETERRSKEPKEMIDVDKNEEEKEDMNKQRNAEFKEKINVKQEKKGTKKEEGGTKGGTSMSLNDKEPTAEVGRVKITMKLGSGSKRREHLRIINSCRTAQELNERTALLRIWRVEIKHDQGEDKVVGDGYCGYAAMTNIIRGVERKLDMRERQDRLEVGMTIRIMMSKSGGSVRKG